MTGKNEKKTPVRKPVYLICNMYMNLHCLFTKIQHFSAQWRSCDDTLDNVTILHAYVWVYQGR